MNTHGWLEFRNSKVDTMPVRPFYISKVLEGDVNEILNSFYWYCCPYPYGSPGIETAKYWRDIYKRNRTLSDNDRKFLEFLVTGILPEYKLPPGGDWE